MILECSICGDEKECHFYKCYEYLNGKWFFLGEECFCSSCLVVQQEVGPVIQIPD